MAELRTFVFSDLVGSVDLKGEMPGRSDAERDAAFVAEILTPHRDRVEQLAADYGGRVVSTAGDGHFLVFDDVSSAALWAIAIEQLHIEEPIKSPAGSVASVRISLHVGSPQIDPRDPYNFVGKAVDYAARLNDFANGEQILASRATVAILEDAGLNQVAFHLHGQRMLKGIGNADVYEVLYDGRAPQRTRHAPREKPSRDWTTIVPGTVGFSQMGSFAPQRPGVPMLRTAPRELGNYEVGELVGTGGMGDVFRATHKQFGRLRAIKVIKPHLVSSGQREVVQRFYQEIKAIGALEHPNIVVAIDSSSPADDTHFLVMEYVRGVSACDLLEQHGRLSVACACEIARQTAMGLDYIHRQGMVHRDVKPSNLMLTVAESTHVTPGLAADGTRHALVKILDLGLALLVGGDHERLTRLDHRAMGTAMYMSPEQWRTSSVDIRSDIYSLGCSLYHLLSGQPPFLASELRPEIAHQKEKVPTIRGDEPLPRALWNVLRKAMAKSPDERYATPGELAEALAPFCEGNNLVELVEEATSRGPAGLTHPAFGGETVGAQGVETRLARGRSGSSLTANVRRSVPWVAAATVLMVLGVAAGFWYAGTRSGGGEDAELLHVAAKLASERVGREINNRFRILNQVAPTLEEEARAVVENPGDESLWDGLQGRMEKEKLNHDADAKSESWFVISRQGVQVARAPESVSVGKNFAFRDYFHGQGANLPEGSENVEPITGSNLSAVYVSTTSSQLKVAFSVPVWNGKRGDDRAVVGVLAMSVDLGDFRVLDQGELRGDKEVLLVDLRDVRIEGTNRRGLILHHHQLDRLGTPKDPPRLSDELLKRVDDLLNEGGPRGEYREQVLQNYADPLGRSSTRYIGAIEPVVVTGRDGETVPTEWIVLVQQPVR